MSISALKISFTPEDATRIQSLFIIPKQILFTESIGCSGFTFTVILGGLMAGYSLTSCYLFPLVFFWMSSTS